ncbi:MAG: hypothetical protein ACFFED_08215 [Candidatus Thorarchaeota archaeon]
MAKYSELSKWLIVIGGILGLLLGILTAAGFGFGLIDLGLLGILGPLIYGILQILVSLIVLATSGIVNIPALKFEKNFVVYLILGIVMWVVNLELAGILVIIGAILLILK